MRFRTVLSIALLLVLGGVFVYSAPRKAETVQNVAPQSEYARVADALTRFIKNEMQDKQLPGFSIALVDNQQIVWAQGFGYADPDKKIPATANTVYRIGSVSKLFTDIGVMQLVERGQLDLDAPIQEYLPDFHPQNPFHTDITLRQLMSHRAGLLREPPAGNYFDPSELSLAAMVHSLNDTTLVYPPETHTKYSNAGVAVVGYVLEKHSGEPFATYLQHAVLRPMGLRDSAFRPEPQLIANLAKAYMWSHDGKLFQAPTFELGMAPAGCMYSTVLDLGKFLSVLFDGGKGADGQVLKRETLERMWTPQFAKPGQSSPYGLGFRLAQLDGHREVEHAGAIYGFATQLSGLPDDKLGVVAVTTMDSANAVTNHVADVALRLMLAAKEGKPLADIEETTAIPLDRVRQLEGRYGQGEGAVDLVAQEGELYLRPVGDGEQVRLRQLGEDLIEDGRLGYGLKVTPVDGGIRIGDKTLSRVREEMPTPVPGRWKGLIGEYGWDYDTLYIFERNGKLTALIEWFEYAPLEESSENVFNFPRGGLYDGEQAVFTRDANGNATQVKVSGVVFKRRPLGPIAGGVFHVHPSKPLDELRKEALAVQPPHESGDFRKPDLVDISTLDPSIHLDIRYASTNDFLGEPVYTEAMAYLQRPAAEALLRADRKLKALGYGILVDDAYRPWYVTKIFWDATPNDKKIFVADPRDGSRHNRGCAIDMSLYDLKTGKPVEMTGVYDEMSERSYPFYPGGTSIEHWHRNILRHAMESEGFTVYEFEWWHFDYKDWRQYPILNITFEQLEKSAGKQASRVERSQPAKIEAIPNLRANSSQARQREALHQ
ncbi:MAG TPA: serine hydrolase [Candidatus Acidoferrales bacterium]|nr:serine hydrolase [Candidatus Acidoferrales bacterium]